MVGKIELPVRTPVARVLPIDPDEFARQFARACEPVVVSGAVENWPATHTWSHQWLREHFGDRVVPVSSGPALASRIVDMPLGDYLEVTASSSPEEQLYLRQLRLPGVLPELMSHFSTPPYCPPGRKTIINLWVGPEGTVQPFHKDNQNPLAPVHNLLVQVRGRKLVSLVSAEHDGGMYQRSPGQAQANYSQVDYLQPDFARFPLFRDVEVKEAVVRPGEIIFIPAGTWHHVRSLDPSISLNFWWYQTHVADVVAHLAESDVHASRELVGRIDQDDVREFGGIWPLALAARTLSADAGQRLLEVCTEEVAEALRGAVDALTRRAPSAPHT